MAKVSQIKLPDGTLFDINDASKLPSQLQNGNETVITDSSGNIITRKKVDGYTVVEQLPTTNIDQNVVYLIAEEFDGDNLSEARILVLINQVINDILGRQY